MDSEQKVKPNSVTYWESRQINIGDYENIGFGGTAIVQFVPINRVDKGAQIQHSDTVQAYPNMTTEEAFEAAQSRVKALLDAREKTIRLQSNSNGNTSFDTLKKGQDFGVIGNDEEVGITAVDEERPAVKSNRQIREEIDAEFDEEFDGPSKPVVKKLAKVVKPKLAPVNTERKKFSMSTKSGLFDGDEKRKEELKSEKILNKYKDKIEQDDFNE